MKDAIIKFLRYTERYTKTDMVYLVKNSGWVFLGQLVTSASAFTVTIVLANTLDPSEYGEYRYVLSLLVILSLTTLPGMYTALTRATSLGIKGQLASVVYTQIRWGILGSLLSLILSIYYWQNDNLHISISFMIIAVLVPFYGAFLSYYFYLQGKQHFNKASLFQILSKIVLLTSLITVAYLQPSAVYLVVTYILAVTLTHFFGYWMTIRSYREVRQPAIDTINYGKYLSLWFTPNLVAGYIGLLATWYYLGSEEAAIFAVIMIAPQELQRLGSIFNQVALPKMSKQNIDVTEFLNKVFKIGIFFSIVWLIYALLAESLFEVFFPKYAEAAVYSVVSMLMILFIPRMILRCFLNAKKKRKAIRLSSLAELATQVILILVLLPLYGLWGAVLASVIGAAADLFLLWYLVRYYDRCNSSS